MGYLFCFLNLIDTAEVHITPADVFIPVLFEKEIPSLSDWVLLEFHEFRFEFPESFQSA